MSQAPPGKRVARTSGTAKTAGTTKSPGTALSRARARVQRPLRLRLIDAVILAAVGLLVLKLASYATATHTDGANLPNFARAIVKARTGYEPIDPTTTGSVAAKEPAEANAEPPRGQPPMPDAVSPTERALLEKLGARRDQLKQRSEELELREKLLGEAERKLEGGLGSLKQAEEKVDVSGQARAESEKAGLKNIVTMYETMKPKDAARVFDRLGHDVLVPIVLAMNPRKMAEVLAVMQPETAERLTVALANKARGVSSPQAQASAGPGLPPNELPAIDPGPGAR